MRRLVALAASVLLLAGCAGRTDATNPAPDRETTVAATPSEGSGHNTKQMPRYLRVG